MSISVRPHLAVRRRDSPMLSSLLEDHPRGGRSAASRKSPPWPTAYKHRRALGVAKVNFFNVVQHTIRILLTASVGPCLGDHRCWPPLLPTLRMRPRGMTLAEVQKGYRDDGDGDDSLSQRQQQQQAPQLSQERQLLQAAAMIHTALTPESGG